MTRSADIESACAAEIQRLREFVAGGCRDWWPTDLIDYMDLEGDDALYLCNASELLARECETRCYYRIEWAHTFSDDPPSATVADMKLYVQLNNLLPAVEVTYLLDEESAAALREWICEDAENKRDQRELADREAEDYYARMEA